MQQVSTAWKQAQRENLLPMAILRIEVGVGDPDAQAEASAGDNGHMDFSQVEEITGEGEKVPLTYATLEPFSWVLDGNRKILD